MRRGFLVTLAVIALFLVAGCADQEPTHQPEPELIMGLFFWADTPDAWVDGDVFPSSRMEVVLAVRSAGDYSRLQVEWSLAGPGLVTHSHRDGDWMIFTLANDDALSGDTSSFLPAGSHWVTLFLDDSEIARKDFQIVPSATERMYHGVSAYIDGDYEDAIDHFEGALILADAEAADYLKAMELTGDRIAHKQEDMLKADIYYMLAYAYRDNLSEEPEEALAKAETTVRQAIRLDPHYHQYYALLGDVLRLQARYSEAIREFNEAIALCLDDLELVEGTPEARTLEIALASHYYWLGVTLSQAGRGDEAGQILELALELDPGLREAIEMLLD